MESRSQIDQFSPKSSEDVALCKHTWIQATRGILDPVVRYRERTFQEIFYALKSHVQSLPELLHHQSLVVDTLSQELIRISKEKKVEGKDSARRCEPLLQLISVLAQEIKTELYV